MSRKRNHFLASLFPEDTWVSTVVGFTLIGLVLGYGFWYVERERSRALREADPTTTPTPESKPVSSTPSAAPVRPFKPASPATDSEARPSAVPVIFHEDSTIRLEAPAWELAVGGAGQFLVVQSLGQPKLVVIDVERGQVAFSVPVEMHRVAFASGRNRLFVVHRSKMLIERWNLRTQKCELRFQTPIAGAIETAVLGADSDGPVLLRVGNLPGSNPGWFFMDPTTFDVEPINAVSKSNSVAFATNERLELRAAANGSTFCAWRSESSPTALEVFTIKDDRVHSQLSLSDFGFAVPSFDGQFIGTKVGLFRSPFDLLRSANENFLLSLLSADSQHFWSPTNSRQWQLRAIGDESILAELPKVELGFNRGRLKNELPFDKRLILVSRLGKLIAVPPAGSAVIVYKTDPKHFPSPAVARLTVTSSPPFATHRGELFSYQVLTTAPFGELKYRLDFAPDGLEVLADGLISWQVPPNFADAEASVILTVRSPQGTEDVHAFVLQVR